MKRSNTVNIGQGMSRMRGCSAVVKDCADKVRILQEEYLTQGKNYRMYAALGFTTLCVIAMTIIQITDVLSLETYSYWISAGVGLILIILITGKIETLPLQIMCILDVLTLVAAFLLPSFQEALEEGGNGSIALIGGIPILAADWVVTIVYNYRGRSRIWSLIQQLEDEDRAYEQQYER